MLDTYAKTLPTFFLPKMSTPTNAQLSLHEARIQLALKAIKQDANLSVQRAAAIYNVPYSTLAN
jgi:hypothetical protein